MQVPLTLVTGQLSIPLTQNSEKIINCYWPITIIITQLSICRVQLQLVVIVIRKLQLQLQLYEQTVINYKSITITIVIDPCLMMMVKIMKQHV